MSIVPGTTRKAHLHPFISLRMLHEALGDTTSIPLSSMVDSFTVEPQSFIDNEYPLNATKPYNSVQNGTYEATSQHKVTSTGLVAVYVTLMVICLVVILVSVKVCCSKANEEDNEETASYGDKTPLNTAIAPVNLSNEASIASMRDKSN